MKFSISEKGFPSKHSLLLINTKLVLADSPLPEQNGLEHKREEKFNIALNIHHGLCVAAGGEAHWRLCDGKG